MNFCKMCGTSLMAKPQSSAGLPVAQTVMADPAAAAPAAPQPAGGAQPKAICPACGKGTPIGFSFCQHCGQRLSPAAISSAVPSRPLTPSPRSAEAPAAQAAPVSKPEPAVVRAPSELGVASTVAVTPTPPAGMPRNLPLPSSNGAAAALPAPKKTVHGLFVTVNRDGSDGQSVEIDAETFDIGKSEGALQFADDPYLASRHLRIVVQGGKIFLRPLDNVNGVFVRVQTCDLAPGDSFLVGKELLRYEPLDAQERDPPQLVEHGVRMFGSAPREAWGRLRQLTVAGTTRDVWHLCRPELVLGREEGDVTFPDDEFMSRRHAAVKRVGTKTRLEDLGSSNGTFVRVRNDRPLVAGDLIRVGDQLLRYEPSA
jgi:pSer/pThr/pTyr-binding forkhead associated (FHA) protein